MTPYLGVMCECLPTIDESYAELGGVLIVNRLNEVIEPGWSGVHLARSSVRLRLGSEPNHNFH